VAQQVLVAIKELDQRAFDVIIPLVARFEGQIFEAPLRFPFRHFGQIIMRRRSSAKFAKAAFVEKPADLWIKETSRSS
jgi:hypothetical protein